MTRIFKVAFCVLTLCGAATLAGCGETGKAKPADTAETPAAGDTAADTTEGSETK